MAIIVGNFEEDNPTPGGITQSWSHTQNTGSDGFLLVSIGVTDGQDVAGITYGGQSMTLIENNSSSGLSQRWVAYGLENPPTGANTVEVTFTANVWNPIGYYSQSFTNCAGVGNHAYNAETSSPHSQNITVSDDSLVYAVGIGIFGGTDISIDGTSYPILHSANTNRQFFGGISTTPATAGSIDVTLTVATGDVTNGRIEILAAGGAVTRRIFLIT